MCKVEILHRAQIEQNAYTEYARTIYFPFAPQVWGLLRSPQLLGECRTLWGEREQAMHYSIDCHLAKALLPVKYQITAHRPFMHGM